MTHRTRTCPNGHPVADPDLRFCEVCGAALPAAGDDGGGQRRPGPIAVGLIGFLAVVVAIAAMLAIVRPGSGPGASPAPSASGAAVASPTLAPTAAPTEQPTGEPTAVPTPEPTDARTSAPTAAPTSGPTPGTSPAGSWPPAATCRNVAAGLTVTYPAAWYAYEGDPSWTCLLFDRAPIEIPTQSELPPVAVTILPVDAPASEVRASLQDPTYWTILRSGTAEVDGFAATVLELEATGEGFDERGTLEFAYVVDLGAARSLVMDTRGPAGPEYDENVVILALMAAALEID